MKIPALSLTQPYASLVLLDSIYRKKVETRNWMRRYRGVVAIHAAAGLGPVGGERGMHDLLNQMPFYTALGTQYIPRGCVLGLVYLAGVFQFSRREHPNYRVVTDQRIENVTIDAMEQAFGDYTPGRFGWLLQHPHRFKHPVAQRGAQGLWHWDVPASHIAAVEAYCNQVLPAHGVELKERAL